jgi:alkyl sulfatase BDS1-like metallo-beta-lactamase superfamily hydrolase
MSNDRTPKPPTEHTLELLAAASGAFIPDSADLGRVTRGLVATHPTGVIEENGRTVWDIGRHDFVRDSEDAPDSVNASLWNQARLNAVHGLFEVAPGLWQARGYDISNITFIAGDTGWLIIDPLTSEACAKACLDLANAELGERPVVGVIYTHSHIDHFGGVRGVVTDEQVASGQVRIIAPDEFLREAVFENVIAGPAMGRRANYQFGMTLPAGPRQHVDSGLGKATPMGQVGLIPPTEYITETGQEKNVDGIRIIFQMTPEAEAPAEMNFFFPDRGEADADGKPKGWLCMAENCSHNMHNLLPLRGAQARDSLGWSKYINEALELFGADSSLMFASHHWPRWGTDDVAQFLRQQRDLYRWMHDQTMRLANKGLVPTEIAEELKLPKAFTDQIHTRGYYGALVHNAKAVYQRYLGWYDGNPAHLWMRTPVDAGKRYVDLAGGADALLAHAQAAYDTGDYRWVAELVNHLVFADPANQAARDLQADALEQLGYQAESATWRNAYLTGAQELRHGPPPARPAPARRGFAVALTIDMMFDAMAIRLKSEAVAGEHVIINWSFTDLDGDDSSWVLALENQAIHHIRGRHDADAAVTVTITKELLLDITGGEASFVDAVTDGRVTLDGDPAALITIFGNLDTFETGFPIVEP